MLALDFTPGPLVILGTDAADTLTGTAAGDIIYGFGGNDMLSGGDGNDTIDGGAGTNRIDSGAGDDLILIDRTASNGAMLTPATGIVAGLGYDTIAFAGTMAEFHVVNTVGFGITITDLASGARTIATGVEHLRFTDGDIWLVDPNQTAPIVSGVVSGATVQGSLPLSLDLLSLASDPDFGAVLSVTGLGALPAGVSVKGSVVTLDPAAYASLGGGITQVVSMSYQVSDGLHLTDAFAQIAVTGVNDVASFDGTIGVTGEDDTGLKGTITVQDVDTSEAVLATQGIFASAHGVFAVDVDWSFKLDTDLLEVQAWALAKALQTISRLLRPMDRPAN